MRIALFRYAQTPNPVYGELASALRQRGHTVWLATPNPQGNIEWHDGKQVVGVQQMPRLLWGDLHRLPLVATLVKRLSFLLLIWRVRAFLRQWQPDLVQVNPASIYGVWLLPWRMAPIAFVLDWRQIAERSSHGLLGKLKDGWAKLWRRFNTTWMYDRACFLHPAGARQLLGADWARWGSVVPLGVDARFLRPTVADRVDEPADTHSRPGVRVVRFIYVGTLSRVRRLEQLIYAVDQLRTQTTDFHVTLLGPDTAGGYYHQLVHDLDLGGQITIRPALAYDQIPHETIQHDVALAYVPSQPRDWQFHPTLKVLEYRALGLPILATDFAPNRDVVETGVNGLLAANTVDSLANAMLQFIIDPDFLAHCRRNARNMRVGVTWADVAEQYEQRVYAPLLALKRPITSATTPRAQRV